MNRLNLSEINLNFPYTIWEMDGSYLFKTDYGIVYKISFMEDVSFTDSTMYHYNYSITITCACYCNAVIVMK